MHGTWSEGIRNLNQTVGGMQCCSITISKQSEAQEGRIGLNVLSGFLPSNQINQEVMEAQMVAAISYNMPKTISES